MLYYLGKNMNYSLLQKMSSVSLGLTNSSVSKPIPVATIGTKEVTENNCYWGKRLEEILQSEFKEGTILEEDVYGLYKLEIMNDLDKSTSTFYIEMNPTSRCIRSEISSEQMLDISVNISSDDLESILNGSLSPLHAYLTGRISVDGDVRKLMLLNKISQRAQKPGAMFDV